MTRLRAHCILAPHPRLSQLRCAAAQCGSCGVSMLSHSMLATSYAGRLWSMGTLRIAPSPASAIEACVTCWSSEL